jgi:hypothetical protein
MKMVMLDSLSANIIEKVKVKMKRYEHQSIQKNNV